LVPAAIYHCYSSLSCPWEGAGGSNPIELQGGATAGGIGGTASLNLGGAGGGQSPIEVGSSTPVDMGMFGGASNQQGITRKIFCYSLPWSGTSMGF